MNKTNQYLLIISLALSFTIFAPDAFALYNHSLDKNSKSPSAKAALSLSTFSAKDSFLSKKDLNSPKYTNSYIVVYKKDANLSKEVRALKSKSLVRHIYDDVFKGVNVILTNAERNQLTANPSVSYIESDSRVKIANTASSWGLDRVDQRSLPLDNSFSSTVTGKGVRAYIVDTGIRATHNEFGGRVLSGYSSLRDNPATKDCNGHGTHVAGTVAGKNYGLAPGAQLVPVRVMDCSGYGDASGIIAGLDWVIADHDPGERAVLNMSIGGSVDKSVNAAVDRVVEDGISAVVSAGNDYKDACLSSPGSAPLAFNVGATNSNDKRAIFSNYGSCVDLFAPGREITSAWNLSDSGKMVISGTSMAAPHVAGAMALELEKSNYTPSQLEKIIKSKATPNLVPNPGPGSPNLLLYIGNEPTPSPLVRPSNDNFTNAAPLILRNNSGNSLYATQEVNEPNHVYDLPFSGASVWYKWTAPENGELNLNTHGSSFDTMIAVYQGDFLNNLSVRASNDEYETENDYLNTSEVTLEVSSGQTYLIVVDGFEAESGSYNLYAFFDDTIATKPNIASAPSANTNQNQATFTFSGEGVLQCSMNGSVFKSCTSPQSYNSLAEGTHYFKVRSLSRGLISRPTSYYWRVDTVTPDAPIFLDGPSGRVTELDAILFLLKERDTALLCSLNKSKWEECWNPIEFWSLSYGYYTLSVRQIDLAGNMSPIVSRTWEIIPPMPKIEFKPPTSTDLRTAEFSFSGPDIGGYFECSIDNSAWSYCESPVNYYGLSFGTHNFRVRLIADGFTSDPVSYSWVINPPEPNITSGPIASTVNKATFTFSGQSGSRFECALDDSSWVSCSSPHKIYFLSVGIHALNVRQIINRAASNPASYSWAVLPTSPKITSAPTSSKSTSARFVFSGQSGASFECRLDSQSWSRCSSPKSYINLAVGSHTFKVRQTKSGATSSAQIYSWNVRSR